MFGFRKESNQAAGQPAVEPVAVLPSAPAAGEASAAPISPKSSSEATLEDIRRVIVGGDHFDSTDGDHANVVPYTAVSGLRGSRDVDNFENIDNALDAKQVDDRDDKQESSALDDNLDDLYVDDADDELSLEESDDDFEDEDDDEDFDDEEDEDEEENVGSLSADGADNESSSMEEFNSDGGADYNFQSSAAASGYEKNNEYIEESFDHDANPDYSALASRADALHSGFSNAANGRDKLSTPFANMVSQTTSAKDKGSRLQPLTGTDGAAVSASGRTTFGSPVGFERPAMPAIPAMHSGASVNSGNLPTAGKFGDYTDAGFARKPEGNVRPASFGGLPSNSSQGNVFGDAPARNHHSSRFASQPFGGYPVNAHEEDFGSAFGGVHSHAAGRHDNDVDLGEHDLGHDLEHDFHYTSTSHRLPPVDERPLPYAGYHGDLHSNYGQNNGGFVANNYDPEADAYSNADYGNDFSSSDHSFDPNIKLGDLAVGILTSEIREWVQQHLPSIVERIAQQEVSNIMNEEEEAL